MLEPITSVSAIVAAKSKDHVACQNVRNGAICGERIEFSTNGMGRLLPQCPVCDWGWKPSRMYDAFRERYNVLPDEDVEIIEEPAQSALRSCRTCETLFAPKCRTHVYCADACRPNTTTMRCNAQRARWRAAGLCCMCGRPRDDESKRSCAKCRAVGLRSYHRHKRKAWNTATTVIDDAA